MINSPDILLNAALSLTRPRKFPTDAGSGPKNVIEVAVAAVGTGNEEEERHSRRT